MKLLAIFLMGFSLQALAEIETMFVFEHREDYVTAQINTGNDHPEISEFRTLKYIGTYDTETKAILITKEFTNGDPDVPIIEPPVVICNPYEGTSRDEVIGLLDRWENLYADEATKKQAFNNIGSMFDDVESLRIRVEAIRILIRGCPEQVEVGS